MATQAHTQERRAKISEGMKRSWAERRRREELLARVPSFVLLAHGDVVLLDENMQRVDVIPRRLAGKLVPLMLFNDADEGGFLEPLD